MILVNIDKPMKKYTIHSSTCTYVVKKAETTYKGINHRDGGWIEFDSRANAVARYQKEYLHFDMIEHC